MFRFSSLAPRIAILFLIAIAIWIGRDPLIQMAITSTIESTVGAKVRIGRVRSSFNDNKVFIKDIAIADPRDPMRNLFQADSAIIELDRDSLLKRRIKIVDATSSQLVFGSPRLHSGAIHQNHHQVASSQGISVQLDQTDPYQNWLDRFEYSVAEPSPVDLAIAKAAKKIVSRLNTAIVTHDAKVEELKLTMREINELLNVDDNPLRNERQLQTAQLKLVDLKNEISSIGKDLTELDQEIANHKTQLDNAKQADYELLAKLSSQKRIDGDTLTKLLLNKDIATQIEEIIHWYLAFRQSIPDPTTDFQLAPKYGTNVHIKGLSDQPAFLIENVQMDGEARLAGNKFNFSGAAKNISLDPYTYDQPVSFNFRAQGDTHFAIDCVLDRTSGSMKDQISVKCPDLELPSRQLDAKMMTVNVSPCRCKININIECTNNIVSGNVELDYDNLVMQIEKFDEKAGGQAIADRVNLDLASIGNYQIHANVSGNLNTPKIQFESDLGTKFAEKLNPILGKQATVANQTIEAVYKKQIALIESTYGEKVRLLSWKLENELKTQQQSVVAALQRKLQSSSNSQFQRR